MGTMNPTAVRALRFDYHANATGSYRDVLDAAVKGKLVACRKHTTTNESIAAEFVVAAMKSIAGSLPWTEDRRWYTSMPSGSKTILGIDGEFEIERVVNEGVYIGITGCSGREIVRGYSAVGPKLSEMLYISDWLEADDAKRIIEGMRVGRIKARGVR